MERETKKKIKGQINFSSGFEFGYWLNDMITARSAWNPLSNLSDENALKEMLNIVTRHFGSYSERIKNILYNIIIKQKDYLIYGKINGIPPKDVEKRNGIAYLQGWDTFSDIPQYIIF
jgi:hypothetical protein